MTVVREYSGASSRQRQQSRAEHRSLPRPEPYIPSVTSASAVAARQARFEQLVQPHLDRLYGFACRQLGNLADAEDVVQESCVRAWRAFGDLKDEARLRPWLYQILRSALSDFQDKQGRRERLMPTTSLGAMPHDLIAADDPGPLEELLHATSCERLYEVLRELPDEFAVAVELHDLDGFRYREISEILGVAVGTVMSRIYRGRKLLAERILPRSAPPLDEIHPELVPSRRALKRRA